jgi:hypothetical protein
LVLREIAGLPSTRAVTLQMVSNVSNGVVLITRVHGGNARKQPDEEIKLACLMLVSNKCPTDVHGFR